MKKLVTILLTNLLLLCSIFPSAVWAQQVIEPLSSEEVKEHYDEYFKLDSRLVNGDFYQTPNLSVASGHPYFISPEWKNGSVILEGDEFDNLLLRYDIHTGQIILNSAGFTNSAVQLVLKKDRIESFIMNGSTFEPFPAHHSMTGLQFCEVLTEGEVDFLYVKSKNLKVSSSGLSDFAYTEYEDKFLRIGNDIISFKNRRTLYKHFPGLKTLLKEYVSENRLKFRSMDLAEQTRFISFCNILLEEK